MFWDVFPSHLCGYPLATLARSALEGRLLLKKTTERTHFQFRLSAEQMRISATLCLAIRRAVLPPRAKNGHSKHLEGSFCDRCPPNIWKGTGQHLATNHWEINSGGTSLSGV